MNAGMALAVIGTVLAIAVVIAGSITTIVVANWRRQDKKREAKRDTIKKKLDDFYGPYQQHLNRSKELYRILIQGKPDDFRTLTYLLDTDQEYPGYGKVTLSENDHAILKNIFAIEDCLKTLADEKAGLIEDETIRNKYMGDGDSLAIVREPRLDLENLGLLALAETHFWVIRSAYNGELTGDLERFAPYTFPRELPLYIDKRISELRKELAKLS